MRECIRCGAEGGSYARNSAWPGPGDPFSWMHFLLPAPRDWFVRGWEPTRRVRGVLGREGEEWLHEGQRRMPRLCDVCRRSS